MRIDVVSHVDEIKTEEVFNKTVIIIDALRTSSTIITAIANGVQMIVPVETIGQAKNLQSQKQEYLLAGDRFFKKISNFHLGNSPLDFVKQQLNGKSIILTTTNGTRAINKALKGEEVLIGSFLNGDKCIEQALHFKKDLVLLCVGERNEFALEDGLAAGFLIDRLMKHYTITFELNDFAKAMYAVYKFHENGLFETIKTTETARKLIQLGLGEDIHFCSQINLYPICPCVATHEDITIII